MNVETFVFRLGEKDDGEEMRAELRRQLANKKPEIHSSGQITVHHPPIITQSQSYDRATGMTVVVVNIFSD